MPGLPARLPAPATVAHQIAGYWSGDHRSRRGDEDEQHCYSHSWRIALLERFWQAQHPPRYAAYLTPSSPRFPHSSNTLSSICKLEVLHGGEEYLSLQLDSLREQLSRTRSQDIGQWIIDLVGVTKTNNIAILTHGVSLSLRGSGRLDTRLDTPPISLRHHPGSRIAPTRSWNTASATDASPA